MRSPGNGHSQLISFRLTKHCLIRNTPVFPLRGVALHLVCFLKCTDCFCRVGVTRDFPRGAAASECHLNYLPISRRAARKASLPDGESHRPRLPVISLAEESKTDCWLWFGKTSLKLEVLQILVCTPGVLERAVWKNCNYLLLLGCFYCV